MSKNSKIPRPEILGIQEGEKVSDSFFEEAKDASKVKGQIVAKYFTT
jgi:hypothetical protein